MITKTSLLATRALLCLAKDQQATATPPRSIALRLGESPAYMAKVLRSLVKAGILRAEHGSKGGVLLNRRPDEITLLAVVEACQGAIVGSYCAFHRAAVELREAITDVLSHWNLEHLVNAPGPSNRLPGGKQCMMPVFPLSLGAASAPGARKRNAVK
jgi:Rrf2 family protein